MKAEDYDKTISDFIPAAESIYPGIADSLSNYGISPFRGGELERISSSDGIIQNELFTLKELSQWDAKIWREHIGKLKYELNSSNPDFGRIKSTITEWIDEYFNYIHSIDPINTLVKASLSIAIELSTANSREAREAVLSHYEEDWNSLYDCLEAYLESPLKGTTLDILIFNSIASLDLHMATVPTEERINIQFAIMGTPNTLNPSLLITSGVIGLLAPFMFLGRHSLIFDKWFWIPVLLIISGTGSLTLAIKERARRKKLKTDLLKKCMKVAEEYTSVLTYRNYRILTPMTINLKIRAIAKTYDWPMDETIMSLLLLGPPNR